MGLAVAPQVVIDATKSLLQCEDHTKMSCELEHLMESCKVLEPTRLDLGATTLLVMLKTLLMMMKTLVMVLKPLWTMEKPLMC